MIKFITGNQMKKTGPVLIIVSILVILLNAAAQSTIYAQALPEKQYSDTRTRLPPLKLPAPADRPEREYLGISGKSVFNVSDIRADIVIIEVFSLYCPICQAQAPSVNKLYNSIQADPDLKDRVKMIGIAATNNPFEARSFKESHGVPFPVFSDEEGELAVALNVRYTPTFIGVRVNGKGLEEQFYWRPGAFRDPAQFLDEILKTSGAAFK